MSMSIPRRQEACLQFIRGGFDAQATVAWMLNEFADEPTIQRAKNPEKLLLNTITMGGTGDQKEMNQAAFSRALDVYIQEERDREASMNRQKIAGLEADVKTANDRWANTQTELNARERRISDMQQELDQLRRTTHQYELQEARNNPGAPVNSGVPA